MPLAWTKSLPAFAGLSLLILIAVPCSAFDPITWSTFDGGGTSRVTGGVYTLGGTIGQPDAGTLSGGSFTLGGGFWHGGQTIVSGVTEGGAPPVLAFRFLPPTPNPVRFASRLAFDLPAASTARLHIFDVTGRAVQTLDYGLLPAGHQERSWIAVDENGRSLSTGVYFLRLDAGTEQANHKVLVIH